MHFLRKIIQLYVYLLFLSIQAYKTYKFFSSEGPISPTPCSRREDMQLVSNHLPLPVATGNNGDRYSHKVLTYVKYRAVSGVFQNIDQCHGRIGHD